MLSVQYSLKSDHAFNLFIIFTRVLWRIAWGGLTHWVKRDDNGEIIKDASGNTIYEETPWFKAEFLTIEERNSVNDIILTEQGLLNINNQKGTDADC